MKSFIIILNGSKGVGKTTLSDALAKELPGVAFFGLDAVRRMISQIHASDQNNTVAVDAMNGMIEGFLSHGVSIVIDGGINSLARLEAVNVLTDKYNFDVISYTLHAPREVLWGRVQERDKKWNKSSDKDRFDYIYDLLEKNTLPETIMLDTSEHTMSTLVDKILKDLKYIK